MIRDLYLVKKLARRDFGSKKKLFFVKMIQFVLFSKKKDY